MSNTILSGDKRTITSTYTKVAGDGDVSLILAVHYGDSATTKLETFTFNANALATNGDVVNVYMTSQVKLGNGDPSQIYLPAGSLDTSDKVDVTITESDEAPGALALARASAFEASRMGVFSRSATRALPGGVTAAGNQYDFSATSTVDDSAITLTAGATATVQIEYDPALVVDVTDLNVWHFLGGTWTEETTSRTVDTENFTISVEVTSLSPFVAAVGSETITAAAGSSGSGCFIATVTLGSTIEALHMTVAQQMAMVLLTMLVVAFLVVRLRSQ